MAKMVGKPGNGGTVKAMTADPSTARSLLDDRKTQIRVLASSWLAQCRADDRILIREAGIPGFTDPATGRDKTIGLGRADFVVFPYGWRQYRDGTGRVGRAPNGPALPWRPAIHMPDWASRVQLRVLDVGEQRLTDLNRADIISTGLRRTVFGLLWHWPRPAPGIWRNPFAAFAARWDTTHGTSGERWIDNPNIVVLKVQRDRQGSIA